MARKRFQNGGLTLRDKSWLARWREDTIGNDGQVRRIRRAQVIGSLSELPTRKLALRKLALLLARVNSPNYRPGRVATLAEFIESWRADVLLQRQPSTVKAAESHIRSHILPQLGGMRLEQLGRENLQAFVACLSRKLTRKTVLNVAGTLSSMLNTAKDWGYVCEGMSLDRLVLAASREKARARFFTAEQARKIIAAAREPYATMFAVAAMTAIRPGELCGLKVDDLDFSRRLIFVCRSAWYGKLQQPKTKSSAAAIPMPDALAERLTRYLQSWKPNSDRLLFPSRRGTPMSANNVVQRQLWLILDKLGIPRCGLHAFRHTHSSLLLAVGATPTVAQAQLRHADPRVTLGIYSHILGDEQRQAVERVAQLLDSSGLTQEAKAGLLQ